MKSLTLCIALTLAGFASATPKKVILDTDPCFDPDDAGCMAMLHGMASSGEIEIVAMMNSVDFVEAPLSISAINQYYNRGHIPVGDFKGYPKKSSPEGNYDHHIAYNFPRVLKNDTDAPAAEKLYREILASSPDKSVTIIVIGTLHNIEYLLKTDPDEFSPLNGIELVSQKVAQVVCMGGNFINHRGHDRANWGGSKFLCRDDRTWACLDKQRNELTRYVIENCPAPFIASGWENGNGQFNEAEQGDVRTGQRLKELDKNNVIRRSYEHHFESRGQFNRIDRHSNDQLALLYATRGARDYYVEFIDGRITFGSDGSCLWEKTETGNQGYVDKLAPDAELAVVIEDLMMSPVPEADITPPSAPTNLKTSKGSSGTRLTWNASKDDTPGSWVAYYNIYNDGKLIGKAHGTQFLDTNNGDNSYRVTAVNINGIESK
ncbi:nucleoside hydrolase [Pelagicoccus mobilis]|uniref:Nucleoside hydrolase n=1 Tax=Pelagicoccus mobilis TaxID=415221 RepID=A0A934S1Q0_9BACT|nr:nucleoside hydrolase [Pelagicoccus mobilis]MBK1878247.1 nucleoside hydrolase [Pelagicoccus mobilis]